MTIRILIDGQHMPCEVLATSHSWEAARLESRTLHQHRTTLKHGRQCRQASLGLAE
jgi:hypothetical protein